MLTQKEENTQSEGRPRSLHCGARRPLVTPSNAVFLLATGRKSPSRGRGGRAARHSPNGTAVWASAPGARWGHGGLVTGPLSPTRPSAGRTLAVRDTGPHAAASARRHRASAATSPSPLQLGCVAVTPIPHEHAEMTRERSCGSQARVINDFDQFRAQFGRARRPVRGQSARRPSAAGSKDDSGPRLSSVKGTLAYFLRGFVFNKHG